MQIVPKLNSLPQETSAEELWLGLKSGDKHAFEQLYRKYVKVLFQLGTSITGDAEFVEDCIQELFIDLWKYKNNIKPTDNVRLYLFRSLSNRINKEKKKAFKWNEKQRQAAANFPSRLESIEVKIVNAQREEAVQKKLANSLKELPIRQNEVIQYLFFENLSYEETAKLMGINLRSVYTLAWKALSTLRKAIISVAAYLTTLPLW
ncbi:RNA polymerase sigma factor [Cyclobacterium jeungdonense]|uniref:Sigma-70 family RNA polymerase sigma factor n=1 Tax=Cyclobacterium jeungdonense TaxID=708087 RepID=A0ABT8CBF6_9BACT|nr:sigma-70 family RNA polymerase sigma factor [Cyclobacterium jeungdonense]MDN3689846.1 sigma-70 family RNA polymerase sigma factor [Cyclobacterium jeungdonense]